MLLSLPMHTYQRQIFNGRKRFTVAVCGRRFGKSELAAMILIARAIEEKGIHAYIAPSYRMAKRIEWNKIKAHLYKDLIKRVWENELCIELITGGKIQLFGADNPDSLRGLGFQTAIIDEYDFISEDLWEYVIRPTLADTKGHAIFLGTPDGFHNLYKVWKKAESEPNWARFQFKSLDNPLLDKAEIEEARNTCDPRVFKQEWEASFEKPSNVVYENFDRELNVRPCPIDKSLPIYVGLDFNISPMSAVLIQEHKSNDGLDSEWWVVDTIERRNSSAQDMGKYLLDTYGVLEIWPDPTGNTANLATGESSFKILRQLGHKVNYRRHIVAQDDKWNAVRAAIENAEGKRRLFIDPHCTRLIERVEQLSPNNDPDDHLTDALGYVMFGKFKSYRNPNQSFGIAS